MKQKDISYIAHVLVTHIVYLYYLYKIRNICILYNNYYGLKDLH